MSYLSDCAAFFRQFLAQHDTTGSVLPSSPFLGRALAHRLARSISAAGAGRERPPLAILEVGPGTGAVTAEILPLLRPGDRLDIVELNDAFVAHLRDRFRTDPVFRRRAGQVRIIHGPLQTVPGTAVYDQLISGLPHNNFPGPLVRDIFEAYRRLLKPGGELSYFEYAWLRGVKIWMSRGSERRRLRTVAGVVGRRLRDAEFDRELVMFNVPPAYVRRLRPHEFASVPGA